MKSMPPCHAALIVPPGLPTSLTLAPVLTLLALPLLLLLPQPDAPNNTTPSVTAPSAIHIPGRLMRFLSRCVSGARWLTETHLSMSVDDTGGAKLVAGRKPGSNVPRGSCASRNP